MHKCMGWYGCECDHRDGDRERKSAEIEKVGQTVAIQALHSLLSSLLHSFLSFATKGKRRRSPTPTSTQSTCRRPCSSWMQCPLSLFVCHPAAISLQLVPGYNATSTEVLFWPDAHLCCARIQQQTSLFFVNVPCYERPLRGIMTKHSQAH